MENIKSMARERRQKESAQSLKVGIWLRGGTKGGTEAGRRGNGMLEGLCLNTPHSKFNTPHSKFPHFFSYIMPSNIDLNIKISILLQKCMDLKETLASTL